MADAVVAVLKELEAPENFVNRLDPWLAIVWDTLTNGGVEEAAARKIIGIILEAQDGRRVYRIQHKETRLPMAADQGYGHGVSKAGLGRLYANETCTKDFLAALRSSRGTRFPPRFRAGLKGSDFYVATLALVEVKDD